MILYYGTPPQDLPVLFFYWYLRVFTAILCIPSNIYIYIYNIYIYNNARTIYIYIYIYCIYTYRYIPPILPNQVCTLHIYIYIHTVHIIYIYIYMYTHPLSLLNQPSIFLIHESSRRSSSPPRHASELHLKDWRHTLRRFGEAAVTKFQQAAVAAFRFGGRTGGDGCLHGEDFSSINLEVSPCFKDEIMEDYEGKE